MIDDKTANEWAVLVLVAMLATIAVAVFIGGLWIGIPAFVFGAFYMAFAESHKREQSVMMVDRTVLDNGAVVVTSAATDPAMPKGVRFMTSAVNADGEVVANLVSEDEKSARRTHREQEARVG